MQATEAPRELAWVAALSVAEQVSESPAGLVEELAVSQARGQAVTESVPAPLL
ncbi:MAG: hypothetical protein U0412_08705 [Nitrospira sp.]